MEREVEKALRTIKRAGPIAYRQLMDIFPQARHEPIVREGFNMEEFMKSRNLEERDEWRKWADLIPEIPFEHPVQVIPPFTGTIVRFKVNGKSVYLDCYGRLGMCMEPYWEVYPYEGDVGRCGLNDVDELLRMIAS